jgi:predicted HTH domain antitoxin
VKPNRALEAIAIEGYRSDRLSHLEVSRLLGLSRIETEDLLGKHQVSLAPYDEAELDREAAVFANAGKRST